MSAGGRFGDAEEVEPGCAKGAHAGGKAHEGNGARLGPNFERFGGQAGHGGEGDNHVSDTLPDV